MEPQTCNDGVKENVVPRTNSIVAMFVSNELSHWKICTYLANTKWAAVAQGKHA